MSSCFFHVLPVNVLCWQFRKLVIVNTTRHEETRCSRDPNSHTVSSGPVGSRTDPGDGMDPQPTSYVNTTFMFLLSFAVFQAQIFPGEHAPDSLVVPPSSAVWTTRPLPADPGSDPAMSSVHGLTIRRVTAQRRVYTFFVYRTG